MDIKFTISAECRAEDVDVTRTEEEAKKTIENGIEEMLREEGIEAKVEVSDLTYIDTEGE